MNKIVAIILSGGLGVRFASGKPKQLLKLAGKSVLEHSLRAFLNNDKFEHIIIVCEATTLEKSQEILSRSLTQENYSRLKFVVGGSTRQESSFIGINSCPSDTEFVVLHDAARPLLSTKILSDVITKLESFDAVDTVIPCSDTIVQIDDSESIVNIPPRSKLRRGQTPQAFRYSLIKSAHMKAKLSAQSSYTDDCAIALSYGAKVGTVEGNETNLKLTHLNDFFIAERFFQLGSLSVSESFDDSIFAKKSALVIGGNGAVGKAICNRLKEAGCDVEVVSRSSEYSMDVTNEAQVKNGFAELVRKRGKKFDFVFNCTGILKAVSIESMELSDWNSTISTNLTGVFLLLKHLKMILCEGGSFVVLGSSSYSFGRAESPAYSCSKAAVVNLIQAASCEYSDFRINIVNPQRINSQMRESAFGLDKEQAQLEVATVAEEVLRIACFDSTGCSYDIRVDIESNGQEVRRCG